MARRRFQQKGNLYQQAGWWKLRWREDQLASDGQRKRGWSPSVTVGPAPGNPNMKPMSEKEARREAWTRYLSRLDQNVTTPQAVVTVEEFVRVKFRPEHIELRLRRSTRKFTENILKNHILPTLGAMKLREVRRDHIQQIVSGIIGKGKSVQTAKHVKNIVSAIFRHAIECEWISSANPAAHVRLPEMERRIMPALSFQQVSNLLAVLQSPYREMVMFAVLTGLNIAEVLGVCWQAVNLSDRPVFSNGETLPPWTVAVRQQWYRGAYSPTKAKNRIRNVPVPVALRSVLTVMSQRQKWNGPTDPVFVARTGKPADEHNIMRRHIKPAAEQLGMRVSWHVFRRTFSTLSDQVEMTAGQRQALMGHASVLMTARYTTTGTEEVRTALDRLGEKMSTTKPEGPAVEKALAGLRALEEMPAQGGIA